MRLILALPLLALVLACTTGDLNATTQSTRLQTRLESPQQALARLATFQVTAVADFGRAGDDLRAPPMR